MKNNRQINKDIKIYCYVKLLKENHGHIEKKIWKV